MRLAGRTDANQPAIVDALRRAGRPVRVMSGVGHGFPDLLTRHIAGWLVLLEVKDGTKPPSERGLTPKEAKFASDWPGAVFTVLSVDDALRAVGFKVEGGTT